MLARLEAGAALEDFTSEYPDVPPRAFAAAQIYAATHPPRGRPPPRALKPLPSPSSNMTLTPISRRFLGGTETSNSTKVSSETLSENVRAVGLVTTGAVNAGVADAAPSSVTVGPAVWVHA